MLKNTIPPKRPNADAAKLDDLLAYLKSEGYVCLRAISGDVCGLQSQLFTTALIVGLTDISYERRYCYEHTYEAIAALLEYSDTSNHPSGRWVKVKGRYRGRPLDDLNPKLFKSKPKIYHDDT